MKKYIVIAGLLCITALSVTAAGVKHDTKSHNPVNVDYIGSIQADIAIHLPAGWTIKRYDRRLVISRTDSAYMQFEQPLNPEYKYDGNAEKNKWSMMPKYKIELYIDFTLESWTDSTLSMAQRHNDSIMHKIAALQQQYSKAHSGMAEYDRMRSKKRLLQSQLIQIPVTIKRYAVFMSSNTPQDVTLYDATHHDLNRQIIVVRSTCAEIVKVKLEE